MSETALRPGQAAPALEIRAYDPTTGDIRSLSLAAQVAAGRWTILFFYPADFTGL